MVCQHLARGFATPEAAAAAGAQESLRKYTVVPVVTRRVAADDAICGRRVPAGTYLACCLQAVHALWAQPAAWRPERFQPGGEYEGFKDDIRPFMARIPLSTSCVPCLLQEQSLLQEEGGGCVWCLSGGMLPFRA